MDKFMKRRGLVQNLVQRVFNLQHLIRRVLFRKLLKLRHLWGKMLLVDGKCILEYNWSTFPAYLQKMLETGGCLTVEAAGCGPRQVVLEFSSALLSVQVLQAILETTDI